MQRQILCLLILACASFISVHEVVGDAVADAENGGAARKLLQETTKTKAAKPDKPKVRSADALSKAKGSSGTKDASEGAKLKEKSRDLDVIQVASKNPDGSKAGSTGTDDVKKPASGGKKGKRVLDEEEDEDIKFMEEEKMEGEEKTTSSKQAQAQTQEGKSASSKKKGSAKKKDVNAGKIKDATETEDLADEGKETAEKKNDDKKVNVDANKEEMDSQEVEIIPDDEVEEQKVDVSEEKETQDVPEQKKDEQKEEEVLFQKDKKSASKVLDQKEQVKKKKKNVEEQVPDTVSGKENATFKKPSTKNGKRPQGKDIPKGNATKSKTAAKEKQKPTKANSTKKRGAERHGEILQKEPKEHIPINFGAGEDVEDLQTDAVLSKAGVDIQGDEEENEDIDFIQEFQNLPNKFTQTAEQVAETLRPGFQKISEKSRTYFSHANEQMTQSFAPIMGEQVAPVVASLISYALLLIPLVVVLYMLERIRATLSLAKVLFFINIYLGAYFITLVLATFALRSEPMAFFFKNSRSSCVFLQLLQALGYLFYLLLYTVVFVKSCSNGGILDRVVSGFQWVIVALFGLHYYVTVFHRAMAMKVPRTTWKVYLVYSAAFAILALFARAKIEPTKKEYYYSPVDDPDEVVPVDKRS